MNAKYALALILSLQVSMCLCQVPTPSTDLSEKYDGLKTVFMKRIMNLVNKAQAALAPYADKMSENSQASAAKDYIEDLQTKPEFQAFVKVATNVGQEAGPIVDNIRSSMLGLYEYYLRPYVGTGLNDGINKAKVVLDKYLPAE